jgi:hypothetical protein
MPVDCIPGSSGPFNAKQAKAAIQVVKAKKDEQRSDKVRGHQLGHLQLTETVMMCSRAGAGYVQS